MKEPSISIQMVVDTIPSTTISSQNVAGGVVIADCGTLEPKLYNSSTEVLKEFTKTGSVTRQTDTTLIHAAAIADIMPVLLTRSYLDDGTRAGFGVYNKSLQNDKVKEGVITNLTGSTLVEDKFYQLFDEEENPTLKVSFSDGLSTTGSKVSSKIVTFRPSSEYNKVKLYLEVDNESLKNRFLYAYVTDKIGEEFYLTSEEVEVDETAFTITLKTGKYDETSEVTLVFSSAVAYQDVEFIYSDPITYEEIYIKSETPLTYRAPMTFEEDPNPMRFVICIGDEVFYNTSQDAPSVSGKSLIAIEGLDRYSSVRDLVDAINKQMKMSYIDYDGYNFYVFSSNDLGSTSDPSYDNEVGQFQSIVSPNGDGFSIILYSNYPSSIDFTGKIAVNSKNPELIDVTVVTANRTYEYMGSIDPDYVNEYGSNQFIGNINDYNGIPFHIEVLAEPGTEILSTPTIAFGRMNISKGTNLSSRKEALEKLCDFDGGPKIAFLCPFGYTHQGYLAKMNTYCPKIWAFQPIGMYVSKDDPEQIIANKPGIANEYAMIMAPHDRSTLMSDWAVDMTLEVAYLSRIQSNAAKSCEFAPMVGKENALLQLTKPSVILSRTTREKLLDARIMSVITRESEGVNYLNKNKCSGGDTVISEEQNIRLACKINRDLDTLLEPIIGKFNTEETRSRVVKIINSYFTQNITNQVYSIEKYEVVCDESNNTNDIRANNKLVVDLSVTYLNAIYDILVYHRALDVSSSD